MEEVLTRNLTQNDEFLVGSVKDVIITTATTNGKTQRLPANSFINTGPNWGGLGEE